MNTFYLDENGEYDEDANSITCCKECYEEIEEYWEDRWKDYYEMKSIYMRKEIDL